MTRRPSIPGWFRLLARARGVATPLALAFILGAVLLPDYLVGRDTVPRAQQALLVAELDR